MAKKARTFAVIGLGTFGGTVAEELVNFGNHVIGIDIDEKVVSNFAETISQALIVDARDEAALREAGVGDCDVALIALEDDLEPSVLCAINLKMIGVKTIWARANTRSHHRILSRLGVDRVVHPERQVAFHVSQTLHNPLVRDFISVGNGFYVVSFTIPESLQGERLTELKLQERFDIRCVGVMRGTEFISEGEDGCELSADDFLLLLGRRPMLREFASSL